MGTKLVGEWTLSTCFTTVAFCTLHLPHKAQNIFHSDSFSNLTLCLPSLITSRWQPSWHLACPRLAGFSPPAWSQFWHTETMVRMKKQRYTNNTYKTRQITNQNFCEKSFFCQNSRNKLKVSRRTHRLRCQGISPVVVFRDLYSFHIMMIYYLSTFLVVYAPALGQCSRCGPWMLELHEWT